MSMFEATYGRERKHVLYDPVDGVVYSRRARIGARWHEDPDLQDLLIVHGPDVLRQYACQYCYGYSEAVLAYGADGELP
jgi:hypothetical protein